MTMTSREFTPAKEPEDIPRPHYRGMLGPDTMFVFKRGEAREALDWLAARPKGCGFRLVSVFWRRETDERPTVREIASA
jgi:hypothetical protein